MTDIEWAQLAAMITDERFSWQTPMVRVVKKSTGTELDVRPWDEMPKRNSV